MIQFREVRKERDIVRISDRSALKLEELLFLLTWGMLLTIHCIENTSLIYSGADWLPCIYMLRYVLYLVLLYKIILTSRYELRQLYFLAVLLLVSGASYLGCGDFTLGELSILCIASLQVDEKHLLHCFAAVKGIAFIMTILLWWMQVLPELYYWNGQNYYLTYGFCHRNVMGANVAFLCLAWFMIRYARLRIWDVLLWCLVAAFLYGIAFSRTTLLFIVLTAAGLYALQLTDPFITDPAELKQLLILLFLTMVLISLYCMAAYDSGNSVWRSIDAFFTTRIRSGNYVYETYGVSPFGRELPFVSSIQAQQTGAAKLILDNTYMRLLLYYGLIPFLLVCLGIPAIISGALYKKQLLLAVCILLVAVFGLSERYMLDAYYNFPLLIGFRYAFDRKPLNF